MRTQTQARMFLYANVLILVLIATTVNSWPQDDRNQKILRCPSTSSCTCIEYSEVEIQCPRFEPHIFVRIQPNNYVHFECENITHNEWELVPEIKLDEARFLQITKCPLPRGKSVATYLKNIHIDRVRSFQFVSSGVNQHIPIESQHFRGLGDIERFDLRGMENEIRELPSDLFVGMEKLTWVRIRVANIQLPVDLFAPLVNLEFLELGHNKLQSLEPGILRNQRRLSQLNLWGNSLRNLNKDSFMGLEQVKELDLSGNGMESLEPDVMFHLTNLSDINLSANNFTALPEGLFSNNRKLKNFRLLENRVAMETLPNALLANLTDLMTVFIKCDLKKIPEDTFEGSENIEVIRLDHNQLDDLPRDLLKDQGKLTNLDLSGNLITMLDEEFFMGAPALKELKISNNRLTVISTYLLKPLTKLKQLYLNDNQIGAIASNALIGLQSVEYITLQNNQLTFDSGAQADVEGVNFPLSIGSPFQRLEQLVELNLINNSITSLFEDYTLISLKSLNLSYNQISLLTSDELQTFSRDGLTIDLTHNRIEEINFQSKVDPTLPQVKVLLNHNPIACDCHILDFVKHLQNRNNTETVNNIKVFISELQCAKPENMANKYVSELEPVSLTCPLDSEDTTKKLCPNDCNCHVRPADRHVLLECAASVDINRIPLASNLTYSYTELTIENQNLTEVPVSKAPGFKEIFSLKLSGNRISDVKALPQNLSVLELHDNNLATLSESIMNFISNSSHIERLTLSGNPWRCDCENRGFMNFVQDQKLRPKIADYDDIKCTDERYLKSLTLKNLCPDDNLFIIIVSVVTAVMGLVLGGIAALYYKYQKQIKMWLYSHNMFLWFVTEEELDKDKRYDAFVSYSHRDQDFVADFLLPELENGTIPYKLCVHERDWSPGLEISTQISNSVNDARRTIIVMSPNYLQSNWAQWEFRVAQSHAATEKRSRIIVILYGDIGDINKLEPEIRDYLKLNTYVKWGDKWFWEKLKYAMPHVKSCERVEKTKTGLVKTAMKSSVDDKLELIKPISVTPPQLTTPPAEKVANPLITSLNAKNAHNGKVHNGYHSNGHINGAYVINTSSRQSDV